MLADITVVRAENGYTIRIPHHTPKDVASRRELEVMLRPWGVDSRKSFDLLFNELQREGKITFQMGVGKGFQV